ncbi:hypothetical protein PPERSA_09026 [Pseudocohnilembus persalinus]|uniref:Uncharacterized protein n=1 Tax=Pseudocohnilembus persalinus TaxID=266149 RepID=A0A0V0R3I4_PSEPJ|nr:hypothetical protein PPERSA_09026 [Pseudocohnilembus persalinus]|eukprot:KRX08922.1 hypothetical protein PPERSA_09026 [Pseudocohnilembus persalinus]
MFSHKPHERKPFTKANNEKRMLPGQKDVYNPKIGKKSSVQNGKPKAEELELLDGDQLMQYYQNENQGQQANYPPQYHQQNQVPQNSGLTEEQELQQLQQEQERIEREIRKQQEENEIYDQLIREKELKAKNGFGVPSDSHEQQQQYQNQNYNQQQNQQQQQVKNFQQQQQKQQNYPYHRDENLALPETSNNRQTTQQRTSQQILVSQNIADKYEQQFQAMKDKQNQQKYGRINGNGIIGNQSNQNEPYQAQSSGKKQFSSQSTQQQQPYGIQQDQNYQPQRQQQQQYQQQQQPQYQQQQQFQNRNQQHGNPITHQDYVPTRTAPKQQAQGGAIIGGEYNYFLDKDNQKIDQHKYGSLKRVPQGYDNMEAYQKQQAELLQQQQEQYEKTKKQKYQTTSLW